MRGREGGGDREGKIGGGSERGGFDGWVSGGRK